MSAPSESRSPNDLFISYSHLDNRPWGAGQRQWVSEFHHELQKRLEMLLGRDVSVWRDDKLAGNDVLDERIEGELCRSRLFLCVMTPRYLKSEWCRREIDVFLSATASSAHGARRPFFKVIKTPIGLEDQPAPSRSFRGYEFFREVGAGKIHEFYPDRDEHSIESREFWQKVDDLAQEMKAFLVGDSPTSQESGRTVFLAETSADVRLARDGIRRELLQRGYSVVPDQPLPLSSDELLPRIEAALARASLTVHPVGARYGIVPEGERRSLVELQLDTALERNGHVHHLVWIAPDSGVEDQDERQQQFLEKLRRVYTERHGTELLERKPLEDLKTRLVEKLTTTPSIPAEAKTRGVRLRVYLICDVADLDAVKPIQTFLIAQGLRVHLPLMEGSEAELRQDHQETLVLCDAVIIYDGTGRPSWLRAKQRDLWKAPGWGRSRPLAVQAVFASRAASDDRIASSDEFLILRSGATFAPEAMRSFMDALHAARDAS